MYADNDGGEDLNFSITAELEADTEYYLAVSYFEIGAEGEISWKIEEAVADTQEGAAEAVATAEDAQEVTEIIEQLTESTETVAESENTEESTESVTESNGMTETEKNPSQEET